MTPERRCRHAKLSQNGRALLLDIARCPAVIEASVGDHACSEIVRFQEDRFPNLDWQPPTPWIGHIELAPILFLGSNPNIGGTEKYPTESWTDDDLVDFFDSAFDGQTGQIADGTKGLQADGSYGSAVKTWSGIRRRAEELLERPAEPGVDYAMAEIVHCRSHDEIGVERARNFCADRYLDRILEVSAARVVVALGAHNRRWLTGRYGLGDGTVHALRGAVLVFLPHPTSWGQKTFGAVMSSDQLDSLRRALR